jgi:hypothetical protein
MKTVTRYAILITTIASAGIQAKTVKVKSTINVSGKVFDGNGDTYVWTGSGSCSDKEGMPPMFKLGNGATLKNLIMKNAPDGIHITGSNVTIDHVVNEDVCEDAVSFKSASIKNIVVKNSEFYHCSDKGISTVRGSNITFSGNYFEDCQRAIRIKGEAKKVLIIDNHFNNVDSGIMVEQATIDVQDNFAEYSDHLLYAFDKAVVNDLGGNTGKSVKSLYRVDAGAKLIRK